MTDVHHIGAVGLAIWAAALVILFFRLWFVLIQMLNNLAPGVSPRTKRSLFDSSPYNPTGQIFHRKLLRLYWITAALLFGGILLIGIRSLLAARHIGPI
jgi:hypothetical protein